MSAVPGDSIPRPLFNLAYLVYGLYILSQKPVNVELTSWGNKS